MAERKRLSRLKILETSVVDHAANPHAKVVLMKRDGGRLELDPDRECVALLRANAEHLGLTEISPAILSEDGMDQAEISKKFDARINSLMKAGARSAEGALLQLAQSRTADDQALWAWHKSGGGAPPSEEVDVNKALQAMDRRVNQLLSSGAVRSRETAIAKIAESRDPQDQQTWRHYKAASFGSVAV